MRSLGRERPNAAGTLPRLVCRFGSVHQRNAPNGNTFISISTRSQLISCHQKRLNLLRSGETLVYQLVPEDTAAKFEGLG